jgi:polar amino acid transport system substrate-binding protein
MQQAVRRRALVGGVGAVVVSAACGKGSAQAASGQGLLARLQAAKRVKVGIANQPPYSALNPDGSLTGVAPEVTKVIMQRLGIPEIEGFIATYGQLIPGMLADRWDFVSACLTITQARCGQVLFCDPLVYDGDIIVSLKETNSNPPKRLAVLAKMDVTIGVQAGGADLRATLAAGVSPSNIRQFTTDPAIMDGLLAKRVQYVLMSNSPARALIAQRSLDVGTAFPVEDTPSQGSGCAFRKEDTDLYGAYQKELRALKASGEYLVILRRYGFDASPEVESITAEQACSS